MENNAKIQFFIKKLRPSLLTRFKSLIFSEAQEEVAVYETINLEFKKSKQSNRDSGQSVNSDYLTIIQDPISLFSECEKAKKIRKMAEKKRISYLLFECSGLGETLNKIKQEREKYRFKTIFSKSGTSFWKKCQTWLKGIGEVEKLKKQEAKVRKQLNQFFPLLPRLVNSKASPSSDVQVFLNQNPKTGFPNINHEITKSFEAILLCASSRDLIAGSTPPSSRDLIAGSITPSSRDLIAGSMENDSAVSVDSAVKPRNDEVLNLAVKPRNDGGYWNPALESACQQYCSENQKIKNQIIALKGLYIHQYIRSYLYSKSPNQIQFPNQDEWNLIKTHLSEIITKTSFGIDDVNTTISTEFKNHIEDYLNKYEEEISITQAQTFIALIKEFVVNQDERNSSYRSISKVFEKYVNLLFSAQLTAVQSGYLENISSLIDKNNELLAAPDAFIKSQMLSLSHNWNHQTQQYLDQWQWVSEENRQLYRQLRLCELLNADPQNASEADVESFLKYLKEQPSQCQDFQRLGNSTEIEPYFDEYLRSQQYSINAEMLFVAFANDDQLQQLREKGLDQLLTAFERNPDDSALRENITNYCKMIQASERKINIESETLRPLVQRVICGHRMDKNYKSLQPLFLALAIDDDKERHVVDELGDTLKLYEHAELTVETTEENLSKINEKLSELKEVLGKDASCYEDRLSHIVKFAQELKELSESLQKTNYSALFACLYRLIIQYWDLVSKEICDKIIPSSFDELIGIEIKGIIEYLFLERIGFQNEETRLKSAQMKFLYYHLLKYCDQTQEKLLAEGEKFDFGLLPMDYEDQIERVVSTCWSLMESPGIQLQIEKFNLNQSATPIVLSSLVKIPDDMHFECGFLDFSLQDLRIKYTTFKQIIESLENDVRCNQAFFDGSVNQLIDDWKYYSKKMRAEFANCLKDKIKLLNDLQYQSIADKLLLAALRSLSSFLNDEQSQAESMQKITSYVGMLQAKQEEDRLLLLSSNNAPQEQETQTLQQVNGYCCAYVDYVKTAIAGMINIKETVEQSDSIGNFEKVFVFKNTELRDQVLREIYSLLPTLQEQQSHGANLDYSNTDNVINRVKQVAIHLRLCCQSIDKIQKQAETANQEPNNQLLVDEWLNLKEAVAFYSAFYNFFVQMRGSLRTSFGSSFFQIKNSMIENLKILSLRAQLNNETYLVDIFNGLLTVFGDGSVPVDQKFYVDLQEKLNRYYQFINLKQKLLSSVCAANYFYRYSQIMDYLCQLVMSYQDLRSTQSQDIFLLNLELEIKKAEEKTNTNVVGTIIKDGILLSFSVDEKAIRDRAISELQNIRMKLLQEYLISIMNGENDGRFNFILFSNDGSNVKESILSTCWASIASVSMVSGSSSALSILVEMPGEIQFESGILNFSLKELFEKYVVFKQILDIDNLCDFVCQYNQIFLDGSVNQLMDDWKYYSKEMKERFLESLNQRLQQKQPEILSNALSALNEFLKNPQSTSEVNLSIDDLVKIAEKEFLNQLSGETDLEEALQQLPKLVRARLDTEEKRNAMQQIIKFLRGDYSAVGATPSILGSSHSSVAAGLDEIEDPVLQQRQAWSPPTPTLLRSSSKASLAAPSTPSSFFGLRRRSPAKTQKQRIKNEPVIDGAILDTCMANLEYDDEEMKKRLRISIIENVLQQRKGESDVKRAQRVANNKTFIETHGTNAQKICAFLAEKIISTAQNILRSDYLKYFKLIPQNGEVWSENEKSTMLLFLEKVEAIARKTHNDYILTQRSDSSSQWRGEAQSNDELKLVYYITQYPLNEYFRRNIVGAESNKIFSSGTPAMILINFIKTQMSLPSFLSKNDINYTLVKEAISTLAEMSVTLLTEDEKEQVRIIIKTSVDKMESQKGKKYLVIKGFYSRILTLSKVFNADDVSAIDKINKFINLEYEAAKKESPGPGNPYSPFHF